MESKKYIVLKNHVREVKEQPLEIKVQGKINENDEKGKEIVKINDVEHNSSSTEDQIHTDISVTDIEELRKVYQKCKSVIRKIETKYGHLLDCHDKKAQFAAPKRKRKLDDDNEHVCKCKPNKKVVFTEDGEQLSQAEVKPYNHICPFKKKIDNTYENVDLHYENENTEWPDSIIELSNLLKKSDIVRDARLQVIQKIRHLRFQHLTEIKYNKESLVKKLKANPEDILEFKGTNISSLEGYPT